MFKNTIRKFPYKAILFTILPIIICSLFLIKDMKTIFDIYIVDNTDLLWNDEMSYFKQIEGIVSAGIPRGYFGYGETHAAIFTLGPWSPMILLPYALFGRLFGWNVYSFVIYNIIFICIAFAIFYSCTRNRKISYWTFPIAILCMDIIIRYCLSGMIEPLNFSLVIIIAGLIFYSCNHEKNEKAMIAMYIVISYLSLIRPYNVCFYLFPIYLMLRKGKRNITWKKFIIFAVGIPSAVLVTYLKMIKYFCCSQLFSFYGITGSLSNEMVIKKNFWTIIEEYLNFIFSRYFQGLSDIGELIKSSIQNGEGIRGKCWLFLIVTIIMVMLCAIWDFKVKEKEKFMLDIITLTIIFLITSGIIMLSDARVVGYRHIMAVCLFAVFIILMGHKKIINILLLILLFIVNSSISGGQFIEDMPYKNVDRILETQQITERFAELMPIREERWDNTVAWIYNDYINGEERWLDYNILYCVQEGFGIQLDIVQDLEHMDNMKSRYILMSSNGEAEKLIIEAGGKLLDKNEEYALFENPKYVNQ